MKLRLISLDCEQHLSETFMCCWSILSHSNQCSSCKDQERSLTVSLPYLTLAYIPSYNAEVYEARAVHFVTHLPSSIAVTVLAKNRRSLGGEIPANIKTIESGNSSSRLIKVAMPEHDAVEEHKKGYDLMVMGSERGYLSVLETEAVKHTDIPLLVIYPERDVNVTKHFDKFKLTETPENSIEV